MRLLSSNSYLTLGFGLSFPGAGLEAAAGQALDAWVGGLINLTVKL